jgi:hypothetical protein
LSTNSLVWYSDWKAWADYGLTEEDFIDGTRLVIFNDDLTIERTSFREWDAQMKAQMVEWCRQDRERRQARREVEGYKELAQR